MIGSAQYNVPTYESVVKDPIADERGVFCYCVKYLRDIHGVNIKGDAVEIQATHTLTEAQKGDVVLLKYGGVSHVALITKIAPEGLYVLDANYKHCEETARLVAYNNLITGIYRP